MWWPEKIRSMANLVIGIIGVGGAGQAHAKRFLLNPHISKVIGFDIKKIDFDLIKLEYDLDAFFS